MKLPFTTKQFINVFIKYNTGIFPIQILFYILGIVSFIFAVSKFKKSNKIANTILFLLWIWMGLIYNIFYFSSINKAAYIFGSVMIIQGLLFFYFGVIKDKLTYSFKINGYTITGFILILYAVIIYPILGAAFGHGYPRAPLFGVAPCPNTIFTFGLLLFTNKKLPKFILIIPFLWSIIGFTAALKLGIKEDYGLLAAGVIATVLVFIKDKGKKNIILR